jgi:serine/threonine protein phosphatase PrpC
MSRSIGDALVKNIGVISEPTIATYDIAPDDKFLIIGSDGLFELTSHDALIRLVTPFYTIRDVRKAAENLALRVQNYWLKK